MPNEIAPQLQAGIQANAPKKKENTQFIISALVALGMIILTFIVAFTLYIPYVQQINEIRDKQRATKAEVDRLQAKYDAITGLGQEEITSNLDKAKRILPDDVRLSELATFVNTNAAKFNLKVSKLSLTENQTDVRKQIDVSKQKVIKTQTGSQIVLGTLEGPFTLIGPKQNIFNFLDFLVQGGYATNFDKVSIIPGTDTKEWSVEFVAVHHYLGPAKGIAADMPLLKPKLELLVPPEAIITPAPTATINVTIPPTSSVSVIATTTPTPTVTTKK